MVEEARKNRRRARRASAAPKLRADWRLAFPLLATVEAYDDHVIARIAELNAYGSGPSEIEALDNLKTNLAELASELATMPVGSELAERWRRFVQPAQLAKT